MKIAKWVIIWQKYGSLYTPQGVQQGSKICFTYNNVKLENKCACRANNFTHLLVVITLVLQFLHIRLFINDLDVQVNIINLKN